LGRVIEVCWNCGFEIPADDARCPGCRRHDGPVTLASRLIAGEALPTHSVHHLQTITPRRELRPIDAGPALGARAAFGYASLLVLIALLGVVLGWIMSLERLVLDVPQGLVEGIDRLTSMATWASVVALGFGLLALAGRAIRRAELGVARWLEHHAF
jgi:hypothetical protein